MLTILFKILGILGILLLVLLGIALTVILLVLFFPLCYKASGQKSADEMRFSVKVRWLFGLVRIFYDYPQPGKLLAKVLFFTVYDSSNERKEKKNVSTGKSSKKSSGSSHNGNTTGSCASRFRSAAICERTDSGAKKHERKRLF